MKIGVMGAGAVGSFYGALLARAGHEVVLIGREAHVAAIRQQGLQLSSQGETHTIPLHADTSPAALVDATLVLCCVKSPDTLQTAREMGPHLAPEARILSLQNGIDNLAALRSLLPHTVSAAVVYAAVGLAGPGQLEHRGGGELVMAGDALDAAGFRAFDDAGIAVRISPAIEEELWSKLVLNCAWNALSAITQIPYRALHAATGIVETMRAVMNECLAVAAAEGVQLDAALWSRIEGIAERMPQQTSSTAQDLARHRRTEIDFINGAILRRADAHGIPVPANRMLHALVKLLEDRPGLPG
ncbi:ketopantoate reductase family protein [Uliginosibacterium paludis]|uniref:2-dehydropantoate 2-reductase n=1 Tax=Uliginosibacterium paludis TaxID=1615952 RepID=A0ABV2CM92_9RHOO